MWQTVFLLNLSLCRKKFQREDSLQNKIFLRNWIDKAQKPGQYSTASEVEEINITYIQEYVTLCYSDFIKQTTNEGLQYNQYLEQDFNSASSTLI